MTTGSCASVGLCYVAQKEGWDVLDFRGGESTELFGKDIRGLIEGISRETGKPMYRLEESTATKSAIGLLSEMKVGREYYFGAGKHAAVMRKSNDGTVELMELQTPYNTGWWTFGKTDDEIRSAFEFRFGTNRCIRDDAFMMDVEDMMGSKTLHRAYGYINTGGDSQQKGAEGYAK